MKNFKLKKRTCGTSAQEKARKARDAKGQRRGKTGEKRAQQGAVHQLRAHKATSNIKTNKKHTPGGTRQTRETERVVRRTAEAQEDI